MSDNKFCAFIDLLGFKNKIEEDFEEAVSFYRRYIDFVRDTIAMHDFRVNRISQFAGNKLPDDNTVSFFSDSILISGSHALAFFNLVAEISSWLVLENTFFRGGIGFGKSYESNENNAIMIVSEGLVQGAVTESKLAIFPRIMIHPKAWNEIQRLLETKEINAIQINHLFIQAENDTWFINPFFLNPDIRPIIDETKRQIKKTAGESFAVKYMWFERLSTWFIYDNPDDYLSDETKACKEIQNCDFFYPRHVKEGFTNTNTIYFNSFKENQKLLNQHNNNH